MNELKKNRLIEGMHSALLIALCMIVGMVCLAGCGESPEEVVQKWRDAIRDGKRAEADE